MNLDREKNEFAHTAKNAGIIGLAALLGAVIGFVLQLLVAYYFGASSKTDAFFMAQSTSEMLSKLLLGGSITAVFLPMFVSRLAKNKKGEAWDLALNIMHLTLFAYVVILFLLGLFADSFISFIAPGFDEPTHELASSLLLVLLPSFAMLYLVELATSMLQALERFAIPAFFRVIAPLSSIIFVLLLVRQVGIYSLALGVVFGALMQLVIVIWALYRQGFKYRFVCRPFDPAIKKLVYLTYPFIFSVLVTQGAGITYRVLVSELSEGSLAAIKFAEKITQLLTIVFLTSITKVIYPILSRKAAQHDFSGLRDTIASSLRLIVIGTVPIIVGIAILRDEIISFVYQRGSFGQEDASMTSIALLFLVIGLTTNGISAVLGHATLALQQTRAAVAVTISSQAVAIALFVLLVPPMAHAGLALASSLVPIAIAVLYTLYLTRFIPGLMKVFWHATYLKAAVIAGGMGLLVLAILPLTRNVTDIKELSLFIQVFVPSVVGAVFYLMAAYMWKVPEARQLVEIFSIKFGKIRSKLNNSGV